MIKLDEIDVQNLDNKQKCDVLLKINNLSYQQVAKATNCTKTFVSLVINGYNPNTKKVNEVKKYFKKNLGVEL